MNDKVIDELRRLSEELRAAIMEERAAIVALDHERLTRAANQKLTITKAMDGARTRLNGAQSPDLRAVFSTLRAEARANATLAATAARAVRSLLGYESNGSYDRRARQLSAPRTRILASF